MIHPILVPLDELAPGLSLAIDEGGCIILVSTDGDTLSSADSVRSWTVSSVQTWIDKLKRARYTQEVVIDALDDRSDTQGSSRDALEIIGVTLPPAGEAPKFEPTKPLPVWRLTFGQQYAYKPHPRVPRIHPDGYVLVEASDETLARDMVVSKFGTAWSMCDPFDPADEHHYPRGVLGTLRDRDGFTEYVETV